MQKNDKLTTENISETYIQALEIIESNLDKILQTNSQNNPKRAKQLQAKKEGYLQAFEKINRLFICEDCCSSLIGIYNSKLNTANPESNLLKRITSLLGNNNCIDNELYFQAASLFYELEPSAASASEMGKMNISRKNYSLAIDYFKQAISAETDSATKAKYYLELADGLRISGSYSLARNAIYSSLEIRPNWGEAYLLLGNIYVAGASKCSGTEFEQSTVYWIAVDAFRDALKDIDTKERAGKKINTYSQYFPTTDECFFNANITSGQFYTIGCWINKKTRVRTSD